MIPLIFASVMDTLYQLLQDFDGTKATSVDDLTLAFGVIANHVLNGGHFEINDGTKIFPLEIEFYYFNEDVHAPKELNDSKMYHKGKTIPYFPILSFYPHESGVDVTFENKEKSFRASFLIRRYEYQYIDPEEKGMTDNPRHLWEDMFGYHTMNGGGINIRWVDEPFCPSGAPTSSVRVNLTTEMNGQKVQDPKPWRFSK